MAIMLKVRELIFLTAISGDVNNHFLPTFLTPVFTAIALAHRQISNVLHDPEHRPCKEAVILVIHIHDDE